MIDSTYEDKLYQTSKFADAVRYNVPKSCATLLCRACEDFPVCVAVRYLTLRIGYERHGRKNPLPYPFSQRSHVGNLRQIRKQGKGRSSKRKENRRLSFLFAHRRGYGVVPAAGRGTFPPSADGESPAEVQRKTSRPLGANTPAAVRAPHLAGAEKEPPRQGEPACGSSRTPFNRCRERSRPVRANPPAAVRAPRSDGAEKFFRKFSKKLTIHGQFSPPSGIGLKEVTQ